MEDDRDIPGMMTYADDTTRGERSRGDGKPAGSDPTCAHLRMHESDIEHVAARGRAYWRREDEGAGVSHSTSSSTAIGAQQRSYAVRGLLERTRGSSGDVGGLGSRETGSFEGRDVVKSFEFE